MADNWIKIEKSTPDKIEVFQMATELGISSDCVLGKLVRVWSWADSNFESGHIESVTKSGQMSAICPLFVLIDSVAGLQGFAESMKNANWLKTDHVPNFERHMGKSAKKRANDSERKRLSRTKADKKADKSGTECETESGLEKRREDISNNLTVKQKSKTKKFSDWDMRFADHALLTIREQVPGFKNPNLESWANSSRLMRDSDGRTEDQILDLWDWARRDSFWSSNILSVGKFREKYDQLAAKKTSPSPPGFLTANEKAAQRASQTGRLESDDDLEF